MGRINRRLPRFILPVVKWVPGGGLRKLFSSQFLATSAWNRLFRWLPYELGRTGWKLLDQDKKSDR